MSVVPRYQIGDQVTVRRGTLDPDFPDIPLGGWTGTIGELGDTSPEQHYLVVWNDYTLANMHPVFRQRCLRDDLEIESMWLRESDLEPAPSQQPALEQPNQLTPRPLRLDHPADRIRAVFGLTSDDPIPEADASSLRRYHAYLSERLRFPFKAELVEEESDLAFPPLPVQVLRLWPSEEIDPQRGLQAEVREGNQVFIVPLDMLVVRGDAQTTLLVQDYASWFIEWSEQQDIPDHMMPSMEMMPRAMMMVMVRWVVYGAGIGASVGAVLTTIDQARFGFLVGAFLIGALGYLAGAKVGGVIDLTTGKIHRSLTGALVATFIGVLFGGILGTLAVAALGSITGSIALNLLGTLLEWLGLRILSTLGWSVLGAFGGALVYAFMLNSEAATSGALFGAATGAGGVVLALLGTLLAFGAFLRDEEPRG